MAYEEYDYNNEPSTGSLKDSLYDILRGFQDKDKLRETGEGINRVRQALPGVAESVGRGAIAAVPGSIGDVSEFGRTYAPEVMEKKFGKERFFPTTREILDYVPRMTPTHEGASTLEDVASLISPGIGGVTKDIAKLTKGVPIGLTIQDVSKTVPIVKETEKLASEVDELGFHSPLENAILKIQQPKGTGEQFLKQLEKTPGVKTEELDVTGVKQYLLDHPNVTKQELLDHMKNSRLKLENKVLGEATGKTAEDYQLQGGDVYHDQDYIDATAEDLHYQLSNDPDIYHQQQQELVKEYPELYEGHKNETDVAARLNQHVEENIKELADTQAREMYYENPIRHYYDEHGYDVYGNDEMGYSVKDPQGRFLDIGGRNGIYDINDAESSLRQHHLEEGNINYEGDGAKYEDYTLPGKYTNYREMLTTLPRVSEYDKAVANMEAFKKTVNERLGKPRGGWDFEELTPQEQMKYDILNERGLRASKDKPTYESGHYDEPNILAHTRLNDRTINGKKTLMVEEIQSDWHQAGRKKGYQGGRTVHEIDKDLDAVVNELRSKPNVQYAPTEEDWARYPELTARHDALYAERASAPRKDAVPDAPFKKNWHELMMKQILNEAVKGNYDAVAFTTGRQQVERYENSLRKAVDKIEFERPNDKAIQIKAFKNGHETFAGNVYNGKFIDGPGNGKTVEEVLGKGIAKQIDEHELWKPGSIEGKDLTIGGEGMKGFYDKILPDFINKYGKKYGMGVKKTNLGLDQWRENLSDEELAKGLEHFGTDIEKFKQMPMSKRSSLYEKISRELYPIDSKNEVHFVELTDAAKKDIKEKGQPLFSGVGLAAPALMPEDQDKTKK